MRKLIELVDKYFGTVRDVGIAISVMATGYQLMAASDVNLFFGNYAAGLLTGLTIAIVIISEDER